MKIFYTVTLLLFLFPAASCAEEEKTCTEMACMDGLSLDVDPASRWEPGAYDFHFLLDGRSVTCQGSLPLKECDDGLSFQCDGPGVMIGESGCALPDADHAISDINIDGHPSHVSVVVKHNGQTIIERGIAPAYRKAQPNGPGCGPVCQSASYDLLNAP